MSRISELMKENKELRDALQEALKGNHRERPVGERFQWGEELRAYQDGLNAVMGASAELNRITPQWTQDVPGPELRQYTVAPGQLYYQAQQRAGEHTYHIAVDQNGNWYQRPNEPVRT